MNTVGAVETRCYAVRCNKPGISTGLLRGQTTVRKILLSVHLKKPGVSDVPLLMSDHPFVPMLIISL